MAKMSRSTFGLEAPRGEDWRVHAFCAPNPDMWFDVATRPLAMHTCRRHCPVVEQCLKDAREHPPKEGVQGGVAWNTRQQQIPESFCQPLRRCSQCLSTPVKSPPTDTGACGTYMGYRRHMKRAELACGPCITASTLQRREYVKRRDARRAAAEGDLA